MRLQGKLSCDIESCWDRSASGIGTLAHSEWTDVALRQRSPPRLRRSQSQRTFGSRSYSAVGVCCKLAAAEQRPAVVEHTRHNFAVHRIDFQIQPSSSSFPRNNNVDVSHGKWL